MKKSPDVHQSYRNTSMTSDLSAETLQMSDKEDWFDYPFNELLVSVSFKFAVRVHYMALLLNRAF
jgi:hypothetical protein